MHQKMKPFFLCAAILICGFLQAMQQPANDVYAPRVRMNFGVDPYHAGPIVISSNVDEKSHAKAQIFMDKVKAGEYGIYPPIEGINREDVIEAVRHKYFDYRFLKIAIASRTQDYYLLNYILTNSEEARKEIISKEYIFDAASAPIAQLLMDYGAPTNKRQGSRTLLHWACFDGKPSSLLEHYIKTTDLDINDDNNNKYITPLLEWADKPFEWPDSIREQEAQKKLKLFVDAGADFNRKNLGHRTALDIIRRKINDSRNEILAGTHVCAYSILAAQLIAAMKAQDKAHGVNTIISDVIADDGSTALHTWVEGMLESCSGGHEREFKDHDLTLLLDAGVNCLHENKRGDTALDILHNFTGRHLWISSHVHMETEEYANINERLSQAMSDQESQMMLSLQHTIVSTCHALTTLKKSIQE